MMKSLSLEEKDIIRFRGNLFRLKKKLKQLEILNIVLIIKKDKKIVINQEE